MPHIHEQIIYLAAKHRREAHLANYSTGLDSQTAWSICALLRKLANNGQAILCTIHQPSAILFQAFDRMLFLAMGGKTLYFGEIGDASKTVTSYFERNGAKPCGQDENPAEWLLQITREAPDSESARDWPAIWNSSEERRAVKTELARMREILPQQSVSTDDPDSRRSFAAPFSSQLWVVLVRVFQQYWRTPSYLYSKVALCLFSVSTSLHSASPKFFFLTSSPGTLHWILLLENAQLTPRIAKPALRHLHASNHFLQLLPTNHAPLRDPTRALRSPRTAIQDVFVASIHLVEHPGRNPVERFHGRTHLRRLVFSDRTTSERRGGRAGGGKRHADVPLHPRILDLRRDIHEHGYRGHRNRRSGRKHHEPIILALVDLLRVCC